MNSFANQGDIRLPASAVLLPRFGDGVDTAKDTVANLRPLCAGLPVNPEVLGFSNFADDSSWMQEHLGGNTTHIETGATEMRAIVDDGDPQRY